MKKDRKKLSLPGWVLVTATALYCESVLYLWTTDGISAGRLAAVCAFALGAGGVLAFLVSLLPERGGKIAAVAVSVALAVLTLTAYFIRDAYKVFMSPETVIGGAGGVAEDYMSLVVSLLVRNLWRIALMLVPAVAYAIFCRNRRVSWPRRGALAGAAAAMYLLGMGITTYVTQDADKMGVSYDFDSAVRCFGLDMALTLELTHGLEDPTFVQTVQATESTFPTEAVETTPDATEAVSYGLNIMEALDFSALAESEKNTTIAAIHSYVASLTPSGQNEYTGLFEGKNLILITAESFTRELLDPELTPTLYRMATEGIEFTDYYQPAWGASTTSGEFSNLVGLVPTNGGSCMKEAIQQDLFLLMGKQLSALGYSGEAYHNNEKTFYERNRTHVCLGYDDFIALYGGLEGVDAVWPESDLQMIDSTVPRYIDNQPFSVYYMTVSGHCMYSQSENAMSKKNYDKVADLPYSEAVKCYIAANLELEYAMESLLEQLEEAGIADDTVIVISPDHYPYGLERSGTWQNTSDYLRELYGVDEYDKFIRDHNALIIWSGCLEGQGIKVDEPVYSLDILPTLSNLFGLEYDSRLLVGRDVFSDTEALVLWPDYSWKTSYGTYDALEKTFTPAEGVTVPEGYQEEITALVTNKITYSKSVLNNDYFNYLSKALGRTD